MIVTGCAHSGMVNIINHAISMSGVESIHCILGGSHLGLSGDTRLRETLNGLKFFDIRHFIPSHCTGLNAFSYLRRELGDRLQFSRVGLQFPF